MAATQDKSFVLDKFREFASILTRESNEDKHLLPFTRPPVPFRRNNNCTVTSILKSRYSVADPGFPRVGGANSPGEN